MKTLQEKLTDLLNQYSAENGSNTPDFILAEYLLESLRAFERAVVARERWYGKRREPVLIGVDPAFGGADVSVDSGALLTEGLALPDQTSGNEPLPLPDQIEAAILEYLYEEAVIDTGTQIDEDAALSEIGVDSLDLVHLFMAMEGQFGVVMSDSFTPKTYRELVDGVVASVELIKSK
jgi:acyl carrier protein